VSDLIPFRVLYRRPKDWNVPFTISDVNGDTQTVLGNITLKPDVARVPDMFTIKDIILECIFQHVLDDAKSQIVVSFRVGENRATTFCQNDHQKHNLVDLRGPLVLFPLLSRCLLRMTKTLQDGRGQ